MTQDTRKDRRVKIVSLNVRYKSATVDEFIENHAHDVSRGGIYIKTASPFPPGTLLKFEIRLASDQAVITGVGRVVWKRETTQGTGERPAGHGREVHQDRRPVEDRHRQAGQHAGRRGRARTSPKPRPAIPSAHAGAAPRRDARSRTGRRRTASRKSTMLGIGAVAGAAPRATSTRPGGSVPPRPSGGGRACSRRRCPETTARPSQSRR